MIRKNGQTSENGEDTGQTKMIMAIVQRGRADKAVRAAIRAGAQAATVFFGRGLGIRERLGLLGLAIQPEKEIVVIVVDERYVDRIIEGHRKRKQARPAGCGIPFRHGRGSRCRSPQGGGNHQGNPRARQKPSHFVRPQGRVD